MKKRLKKRRKKKMNNTVMFKPVQPKKTVFGGELNFVKGTKGFQRSDVTFAYSASYVRTHQIEALYLIAA